MLLAANISCAGSQLDEEDGGSRFGGRGSIACIYDVATTAHCGGPADPNTERHCVYVETDSECITASPDSGSELVGGCRVDTVVTQIGTLRGSCEDALVRYYDGGAR